MALTVPRFIYPNRVWDPVAILYASSADPAAPLSWIRDQLRSKAWRSRLGWNIVAGFNNKFDFIDNGVAKVATVAALNYATGALAATQLTTAMNAVAGITNTYLVTYDSVTGKFTFARATGSNSFGIELSSVDPASCAKDVGFNLGVDKTGATSYLADLAAYHSREFLKVDLGSALACAVGIVLNHNAGAVGTFTLQGHTSDAWTVPDVSQVLAGDATIRLSYFSSASKRWWRLVVEDVQNTAGYSEVGIWYPAPYTQPAITYSIDFVKRFVELSNVEYAPAGAHFQDQKPRRQAWSLSWLEIPDADRLILEAAAAAAPVGRNLVMAFDATGDTLNVGYGFFSQGLENHLAPVGYWTIPLEFSEALG